MRVERKVSADAFWFDGENFKDLDAFLVSRGDGSLRDIYFDWMYDIKEGKPYARIEDRADLNNPPCMMCLQSRGWIEVYSPTWVVIDGRRVTLYSDEGFKATFQ